MKNKNVKFVLIMGAVILLAIVGIFFYKGSATVGKERLQEKADKAKEDRREKTVVSNEAVVPEYTIDQDEAAKRVEEIREILDNDGSPYHRSEDGSTHLLTYAQIESAYRPLAQELEMILEHGQGDWNQSAWSSLAYIYLHLGEMDKCLEARRRGYEATGWEGLLPDSYENENGVLTDEYGRMVGYCDGEETIVYKEADRYITWDYLTRDSESVHIQFEYDDLGRMQKVLWKQGEAVCEYGYEYQGEDSVTITKDDGLNVSSCTLHYDEYGDYGTFIEWEEAAEEEAETSEAAMDSDEIARRVEEISAILGRNEGPGFLYSHGTTNFLTYEQIEAAYRPLAEELEMYLGQAKGDWEKAAWTELSSIYCHLGEMDKCLEANRYISYDWIFDGGTVHNQLEYDSLGRIKSVQMIDESGSGQLEYQYQGDCPVTVIARISGEKPQSMSITYDEYGCYSESDMTEWQWME